MLCSYDCIITLMLAVAGLHTLTIPCLLDPSILRYEAFKFELLSNRVYTIYTCTSTCRCTSTHTPTHLPIHPCMHTLKVTCTQHKCMCMYTSINHTSICTQCTHVYKQVHVQEYAYLHIIITSIKSTLRIADTLVHRPLSFIRRVSFIWVLGLYHLQFVLQSLL